MKNLNYERCLVHVITEQSKKEGLNQAQLARAAWPGIYDPAKRWRNIRNKNVGKPQGLTISDAACLAEAIGKPLSLLCLMVEEKLGAGWRHEAHDKIFTDDETTDP